jgi:hypothetical protein
MKLHPRFSRAGLLAAVASAAVAGCASQPRVGVSDVAVFTTVHLLAAEASADLEGSDGAAGSGIGQGPFTAVNMRRYFESTTKAYKDGQERMDAMLDGEQRRTAMAQATQTQAALSLTLSLSKSLAATQPTVAAAATTLPASFVADQVASLMKSASDPAAGPVGDSPFDQLDRVADFFSAYVVKSLRVRGDSRVVDQRELAELMLAALSPEQRQLYESLAKDSAARNKVHARLVLFVFQAHVDPGNARDTMVGVRLRLKSVEAARTAEDRRGAVQNRDVKVIRLHPTRTYDVDRGVLSSTEQTSVALAAQAGYSAAGIAAGGNGSFDQVEENAERDDFLTHLNKITSVSDAAQGVVGFNFYPTNVKVERQNLLARIFGGRAFVASGSLEGGARDCAMMLVVPRDLAALTYQVTYVRAPIDGGAERYFYVGANDGLEHEFGGGKPPEDCEALDVTLPTWDPIEGLAAAVGAAPITRASTRPTTGPASGPAKATSPSPKVTVQVKVR